MDAQRLLAGVAGTGATAATAAALAASAAGGSGSKTLFQGQSNQEHSHSTQASPTNTLKHVKRQRARSADESNKNLLNPTNANEENWV